MDFYQQRDYFIEAVEGPLPNLLDALPTTTTYQRVAPEIAAQHTMRAQAILSLGDTPKHQHLALQHLEAAFLAANPGWVR
jgi:hypothetical protein